MCGIVGFIGQKDPVSVLLNGLKHLEYRGYDSAGIATLHKGRLSITKAEGKLQNLFDKLASEALGRESNDNDGSLRIGLGHTRWATHGKPSEVNAHPHSAGRIAIIHNGIIENYVELRNEVISAGKTLDSETDTEIAAAIIEREIEKAGDGAVGFNKACSRLKGSYAILAIDSREPDKIFVAKTATPIVIGIGEKEVYIASDFPALLDYTRDFIVLEDGDIATLCHNKISITNSGIEVKRPLHKITWDPVTAQKGGYKHFMLKEINEQSSTISDALIGKVNASRNVELDDFNLKRDHFTKIKNVTIVACGTAYYAGLLIKQFIESIAKVPCKIELASEFRYQDNVISSTDLIIAISQSGETADTVAALEKASKQALTMAICNVVGSTLTRKTENVLYTHAGPEISVASTKAFTAQLVTGYLLALHMALELEVIDKDTESALVQDLLVLPRAVATTLRNASYIEPVARAILNARSVLYLGRAYTVPIALEGALKLKELSYIHAEGLAAGEIKHGSLALIEEGFPVIVLLQGKDELFKKSLSSLREVQARGALVIAISDLEQDDPMLKEVKELAKFVLTVPYVSEYLSPIVMNLPLQLLAYHVAVLKGSDVDLPRNLAKSVTVE
jgi:glucosamine--fructose-6-phosphate aminotransferase (isomerizing)